MEREGWREGMDRGSHELMPTVIIQYAYPGVLGRHPDLRRFMKHLINGACTARPVYRRISNVSEPLIGAASKAEHVVKLGQPDWNSWSHSLAFGTELRREDVRFHWNLNPYWEPVEFELAARGNSRSGPWRRRIDTDLIRPTTSSNGRMRHRFRPNILRWARAR